MTFVTNLTRRVLNSLLPPAFLMLPVEVGLLYHTVKRQRGSARDAPCLLLCLSYSFFGQLTVQHILDLAEQALVLLVWSGVAQGAGKLFQEPLLLFVEARRDLHLHHHHHVTAT